MTDLQLLKRKKSRIKALFIVYAIIAIIVVYAIAIMAGFKLADFVLGFFVVNYPLLVVVLLWFGILIYAYLEKCDNDIDNAERDEERAESDKEYEKALASFPKEWEEIHELYDQNNPIFTFLINEYVKAIYVRKDYGQRIKVKIVCNSQVPKKKKKKHEKVITKEWPLTLEEAEEFINLDDFF